MRRPAAALVLVSVLSLAVPPGGARAAETCPDVPDEETALRREMAREWFAKAEEAERVGDRQTAVKRYTCSLKLAPHPSTAYNLGTAAEKSGDLSMAVDAFRMYLTLTPEAVDRVAVEARVARLEAKIAELRQQLATKPVAVEPVTPARAVVTPAATADSLDGQAPGVTATPATAQEGHRTAGLVTLGGGVAALGAGIVLNVLARHEMSDCYAEYAKGTPHALDRCDDARPLAYGSYGLFGLAGALGVVGVTLLLLRPESPATSLSLWPVASGGGVSAGGRF